MPGTHHEFEATRGNLFHQAPPDSGSGKWATEKTFGYTMAVVLIGLQGLWWTEWYQYFVPLRALTRSLGGPDNTLRVLYWVPFFLTLAALVVPVVLWPLNKIWMFFGEIMGSVMGRVILGLIYYGIVTPIGFMRQKFFADPMQRRPDSQKTSYWQPRPDTPFDPNQCTKQF